MKKMHLEINIKKRFIRYIRVYKKKKNDYWIFKYYYKSTNIMYLVIIKIL